MQLWVLFWGGFLFCNYLFFVPVRRVFLWRNIHTYYGLCTLTTGLAVVLHMSELKLRAVSRQWACLNASSGMGDIPHTTPRQSYSQVTNKCFVPPPSCCTLYKGVMMWLQSLHQQNSPYTPYHHQRHLRFSEKALQKTTFLPLQPALSPVLPLPSSNQGQGISHNHLVIAKTQFKELISQDWELRHVPKKPVSFPNIASSECLPKSQAPTLLEGAQNKIKTGC